METTMSHQEVAQPIENRYFTPGTVVLLALVLHGFVWGIVRFFTGIGGVTNLDNHWPWGIWIAIDVACGVALAAGGFTTSAIAHIFHREKFHPLVKPALLTAMLGYTFVALGLLLDLGRYYNIWHPMLPIMWHGESVLFEVGMCVTIYLMVLYIEFFPIFVQRYREKPIFSETNCLSVLLDWIINLLDRKLSRIMSIFIIAGVLLSCLHQSSLGTLMLIAHYKMHPLWNTPISPLLFLVSAIMVGPAMVIFESLVASRSFQLKPEMELLSSLSKFIPLIGIVYLGLKIGDMAIRESYVYLLNGSMESTMFLLEILFGVLAPVLLLISSSVRNSSTRLFLASSLVIIGVILNRINVFLVAYNPVYATKSYLPSFGEISITLGLISALVLTYRFVVMNFPVISHSEHTKLKITR